MRFRPTAGLRREVLPNGITLLVQSSSNAPAATQLTLVRAGFLDEPDELTGISHVLEHMLFKGTPDLAPGELAQRTKELGGSLNAWTSYDSTVYYATMPARHAFAVASLQADQVQHALIDSEELRRELGVIIQEARRKLDTPAALVGETLHRLLYHEHRLRRWRIGLEEELAQLTDRQVRTYYHSRYRPDRTIVTLVGDLDPDQALNHLRELWGGWIGQQEEIPAGPAEISFPASATEKFAQDVTQAEMVLGWRAPGILHPDAPALELIASLLSVGRGSWFNRMLRDPGIVAGAGASHYGVADTGVFAIGVEAEPPRVREAVEGITGLIGGLQASPPARQELDRAVTLMRTRWQRVFDRTESRAVALAAAEARGDLSRLDEREARWQALSPEQISAAARQYLALDTMSGVISLPRESDTRFDRELLQVSAARVTSPQAALPAPVRTQPRGAAGGRQLPVSHGVHRISLDSLDILTARHGETDQVVLQWYGAVPQPEDASTAGQSALAIRSMLRGTRQRDGGGLAFAFESLGGSLVPLLSPDLVGFSTTILSEHAVIAAALLAEVIATPAFNSEQVEIERRLLLNDAESVADDMFRYPLQLLMGQAFADCGYGAPPLGTADSLGRMDHASTLQWHRQWRDRGRNTLIAVGPGDPAGLAEQLAASVGGFQGAATRAPDQIPTISIHPGIRQVKRVRHQSALAMLFPGPSRASADRFAAELWGGLASGLGGRLFESLRSEKSLAYTVIATSWQRRNAGGLLTYIATDPERLEEAREEMLAQLDHFRDQPPTGEELERSRAQLIGQSEISRESAAAVAGAIAESWLFDGNLEEYADPAAGYRLPALSDIHRVTHAAFLDPGIRAEAVVVGQGKAGSA